MMIFGRHNRWAAAGVAVLACLAATCASAQMPPPTDPLSFNGPDPIERFKDIEIKQHVNAQLPLDLEFTDETGRRVRLGDYLGDKPALLAFVYYECPMMCKAELEGLETVVKAMKFQPGEDYEVITVSIDPDETVEMAAAKKKLHIEHMNRPGAEKGWHFLIGDEESIARLAEVAGFGYRYDPKTDQYAHAAGIMTVTPDGRMSRYFFGVEYIRRDLELGLTEASEGRIGSIVDKVVLLCFQYDPSTGKYGLYVFRTMQMLSALLIASFAAMYTIFYFRTRKKKRTRVRPKNVVDLNETNNQVQ